MFSHWNLKQLKMANHSYNLLGLGFFLLIMISSRFVDGLSSDYYAMSCPVADNIVKRTMRKALYSDFALAPNLLRMHFHDCFVEGCDGSVLIDSTNDIKSEKESTPNARLLGYDVIDNIKKQIEWLCPGVVSCADILAMAAREAVIWSGGPRYEIPKGRKDGRRSKLEDTFNLPSPFFNSTELITAFAQRGFNVQELVALSGAHTLGVASCATFKHRLSNFDSTNDVDPSLHSDYANILLKTCRAGDNATASLDQTRYQFDNAYFKALQNYDGILSSDQVLFMNSRTNPTVNAYANNQAMFFYDFAQVMIKLSLLDVKDSSTGEVRLDCRKIN